MKPFIVLMFLVLHSVKLHCQLVLRIEIQGLRNNRGCVYVDFRDSNNRTIDTFSQNIKGDHCSFVIPNLKEGAYAFRLFHDENGNKKLDSNWLGIPIEGFGFSNNAMGRFGPPDFIETLFEVKSDTIVSCKMRYFNF
ncbi:DUF2141 domain-containing protein [Tenuifilum thalassicum]|uniref:DUF2141 domain-containing protein n=1 Tax=Tenuifilum thalassicum TaxID=2590900 RepID=A0A7D4CQD2_9BACT|nr:DUF2141 domain-containing protein [Tenuifilum thalassicum]QKG79325.1 DUF2141 domain-containing protein [Tenuifilum thalassicum]